MFPPESDPPESEYAPPPVEIEIEIEIEPFNFKANPIEFGPNSAYEYRRYWLRKMKEIHHIGPSLNK